MALNIYGGSFAKQAELILRGCCHFLFIGDSQSYQARNFTLAATQIPSRLAVRWNYVISSLATAPQTGTYSQTGGVSETVAATTTGYGAIAGNVNSGAGTPALGAPTTRMVFTLNSTATDWTWTAPNNQGGWLLQRECAASATKANQYMPWPLLANNSYNPWFHGAHHKCAIVVQGQTAGSGVISVGIGTRRVGGSATGASSYADVAITDIATIMRTDFTPAVADAGNYQTATANGLLNDHYIQLGARSASGYDETGKSIIFMRGVWARCDSGGTITWNNTDGLNSGAGYDSFGRSGSAITDWETNYWTQAQWAEYFSATVQVPNQVTVMAIMLGHNCVQISGNVVTAAFTASWVAFIAKLRAAYEAAWPVALYPSSKLHLMIITPWFSDVESNFMSVTGVTGGRSMQAVYESLANSTTDCSWFSFFNYFNESNPFDTLHADNEVSGNMLGEAFFDALHRSTDFRYSAQGAVGSGSSRTIRLARV